MMPMDPALEALAGADPRRGRGGNAAAHPRRRHEGFLRRRARRATVLETRVYAGIVDYEPTELVLTARAGTSLAAIESAMRARGQMLAFEPPHFGDGATLGGAVAAGLSGPRRPYAGAVRDFVLGVRDPRRHRRSDWRSAAG